MTSPRHILRGSLADEGAPAARDPEAGGISPGVIILLLVIVALFVFAVLAGSRGGLSAGGGLPTDAKGRRALFDRWFAPAPLVRDEMKLTHCVLSEKLLLTVDGDCTIEVPGLPKPPESWKEKIHAAFHSDRRRLFLTPKADHVRLRLFKAPPADGPPPDPLQADLQEEKEADVTFAPDGVTRVQLICDSTCKLDLSRPTEE